MLQVLFGFCERGSEILINACYDILNLMNSNKFSSAYTTYSDFCKSHNPLLPQATLDRHLEYSLYNTVPALFKLFHFQVSCC